MLSYKKNKIYIIEVNSNDFLDCTLESIEKINESHCILISKYFNKHFINILKKNEKKLIFEESLTNQKNEHLWEKIKKLSKNYCIISHIRKSELHLFNDVIDEKKFFEKNNLETECIIGVFELIHWLNKAKQFLTNRDKNSSVIFANNFNKKKINIMLLNEDFEKIIIRFYKKSDLLIFFHMISNLSRKIRFTYKLLQNGKIKTLKSTNIDNIPDGTQLINNIYILVERK